MYSTQARRFSTLRTVALRGGKVSKSPVAKAMHLKTNPGLAGLIPAAKVIVPQALVGGGAMFGLAFVGKTLSNHITHEAAPAGSPAGTLGALRKSFQKSDTDPSPKAIVAYMPAIGTVISTGVAFVIADKVAPKFKGAVAIGGLLGAIVQAIVAKVTADAKPESTLAKIKDALLGDYTTVGSRAYAEGGIFREVGDYTTVGDPYSNARPRNTSDNRSEWATNGIGAWDRTVRPRQSADNSTEWASNGMSGMDDTTEFAPGEGGVLAGGMFRGPSTR